MRQTETEDDSEEKTENPGKTGVFYVFSGEDEEVSDRIQSGDIQNHNLTL